MKFLVAKFLCLAIFIYGGSCCTKKLKTTTVAPTTTTTEAITTTTTEATTTTQLTTTTTAAVTTTQPTQQCQAISCNFESNNPCSYTPATSGTGSASVKQFQVVTGKFQNSLTGIPGAGEGTYYSAVYLNPGDTAALTTNVNFPSSYLVKFMYYRATEGVDLQACCDSISNCPYSTTSQVATSDYRQWKTATMTCPAGTTKVIFQAKNTGKNYGAVGLDNIQLLQPGTNQPVC